MKLPGNSSHCISTSALVFASALPGTALAADPGASPDTVSATRIPTPLLEAPVKPRLHALAQLGDRAGALTALRNALLLDGARADAQLALGKLLFDCGQLEHALVYFARATA